MSRLLKTIIALFSLISMTFGAFFFLDSRHAQNEDLVKLEARFTLNELYQLLRRAEDELYYYRDLNRKYPNDVQIRRRLRNAERRVQDLRDRIKRRQG